MWFHNETGNRCCGTLATCIRAAVAAATIIMPKPLVCFLLPSSAASPSSRSWRSCEGARNKTQKLGKLMETIRERAPSSQRRPMRERPTVALNGKAADLDNIFRSYLHLMLLLIRCHCICVTKDAYVAWLFRLLQILFIRRFIVLFALFSTTFILHHPTDDNEGKVNIWYDEYGRAGHKMSNLT